MLSSAVHISLFGTKATGKSVCISQWREMEEAQWLEPITPPWLFIKTASAVPPSICHNVFTIYPPFLSSLPAHHWHLGDLSRLLLKQSFATRCNLCTWQTAPISGSTLESFKHITKLLLVKSKNIRKWIIRKKRDIQVHIYTVLT